MKSAMQALQIGIILFFYSAPSALPPRFHQKDLITGLDAVSAAVLPDGAYSPSRSSGRSISSRKE